MECFQQHSDKICVLNGSHCRSFVNKEWGARVEAGRPTTRLQK